MASVTLFKSYYTKKIQSTISSSLFITKFVIPYSVPYSIPFRIPAFTLTRVILVGVIRFHIFLIVGNLILWYKTINYTLQARKCFLEFGGFK